MKFEQLLANSKGQSLIAHCENTALVAEKIANLMGLPDELVRAAREGGLFHDIAKAIPYYQNLYLAHKCPNDQEVNPDIPRHNEIGWAMMRLCTAEQSVMVDIVINSTKWHHAELRQTPPEKSKYENSRSILSHLKKEELESLVGFIQYMVGRQKTVYGYDTVLGTVGNPDFRRSVSAPPFLESVDAQSESLNPEYIAVRTCVMAADRYVSMLSVSECNDLADNLDKVDVYLESMNQLDVPNQTITCPVGFDPNRFQVQRNCVDEVLSTSNTHVINLAAGEGKTTIMFVSTVMSNQKSIVVLPDRSTQESVYRSLCDLTHVFDVSLSIEMIQANERIALHSIENHPEPELFNSDIVVTTIDSLIRPMNKMNIAHRMFFANTRLVWFDEYHKLVSDAPIFAMFIELMRYRHRLANNLTTGMLSATPENLYWLWDSDVESNHLPSEHEHYPPFNNPTIKFKIVDGNVSPSPDKNSLTIFNSVVNAQRHFLQYNTNGLYHRKEKNPLSIDRDMEILYENIGKQGTKHLDTDYHLTSAQILGVSHDISVRSVFSSLGSPAKTPQDMGRNGRFPDSIHTTDLEFTIFDLRGDPVCGRSEQAAMYIHMNATLINRWKSLLLQHIDEHGELITRQKMYTLYNSHCKTNESDIVEFYRDAYVRGTTEYSNRVVVPHYISISDNKLDSNPDGNDVRVASGNLRNVNGSYFITMRDSDGNWLSPDEIPTVDERTALQYITDVRNMNSGQLKRIATSLSDVGFDGYNNLLKALKHGNKSKSRDDNWWLRMARRSDFPIPNLNSTYFRRRDNDSPEIGPIPNDLKETYNI